MGYKEIHKDLYLVPIEIGQVVRLNNVFFDFDKSNLRSESFVELDRVVKLLTENPAIEIEEPVLIGHQDKLWLRNLQNIQREKFTNSSKPQALFAKSKNQVKRLAFYGINLESEFIKT